MNSTDALDAVDIWKLKQIIKSLDEAEGQGTSMISLIIPPKEQIPKVSKKLTDEYGASSNIKDRTNRLSVLDAITSTQQRLKLYRFVPTNGLIIYCGTVFTKEGKEKKITIDIEPIKPINTSLYLCDNKFHTDVLKDLTNDDKAYGFIVIDGAGTLFGILRGNTKEVLQKIVVDLPKKHNKGGQSAPRFGRLRVEKRHNYIRKISESSILHFITNDRPNVSGLVLAGFAEFKNELAKSDLFDERLHKIILTTVDISYGGENGFNQAIDLASECLSHVKFVQEKKLLFKYMDEISKDTGLYSIGINETMYALESGAVETLIISESLDEKRYVLKDGKVIYASTVPKEDIIESILVTEWLANNYKSFGAKLEFVSDKSQEGSQFYKGLGGIGALLRYKMDFTDYEHPNGGEERKDDSEEEPLEDEDDFFM